MPTKKRVNKYVIDASVAVKWFSVEDMSEKAREIFKKAEVGNIELFAPNLILSYVHSVAFNYKNVTSFRRKYGIFVLK